MHTHTHIHTHTHTHTPPRRRLKETTHWGAPSLAARAKRAAPGRSLWSLGSSPRGSRAESVLILIECLAVVPATATGVLVIAALAGDLVGCYYLLLQPLLLLLLLLLLFPLWLLWF